MGYRNTKKLSRGEIFETTEDLNSIEDDSDTPTTLIDVLNSFKKAVYFKLKWSLYEIDNTDFFNLLKFFNGLIKDDKATNKTTKIIDGEEYTLSKTKPAWMN